MITRKLSDAYLDNELCLKALQERKVLEIDIVDQQHRIVEENILIISHSASQTVAFYYLIDIKIFQFSTMASDFDYTFISLPHPAMSDSGEWAVNLIDPIQKQLKMRAFNALPLINKLDSLSLQSREQLLVFTQHSDKINEETKWFPSMSVETWNARWIKSEIEAHRKTPNHYFTSSSENYKGKNEIGYFVTRFYMRYRSTLSKFWLRIPYAMRKKMREKLLYGKN